MARYLETAAQANDVAKNLLSLVPEENRPQAAEMIARLVNFGIRCSPRAVMGTVRFNAVKRAVEGLPVTVRMEERTDVKTQRKYKALITTPVGKTEGTVEGMSDEE